METSASDASSPDRRALDGNAPPLDLPDDEGEEMTLRIRPVDKTSGESREGESPLRVRIMRGRVGMKVHGAGDVRSLSRPATGPFSLVPPLWGGGVDEKKRICRFPNPREALANVPRLVHARQSSREERTRRAPLVAAAPSRRTQVFENLKNSSLLLSSQRRRDVERNSEPVGEVSVSVER